MRTITLTITEASEAAQGVHGAVATLYEQRTGYAQILTGFDKLGEVAETLLDSAVQPRDCPTNAGQIMDPIDQADLEERLIEGLESLKRAGSLDGSVADILRKHFNLAAHEAHLYDIIDLHQCEHGDCHEVVDVVYVEQFDRYYCRNHLEEGIAADEEQAARDRADEKQARSDYAHMIGSR